MTSVTVRFFRIVKLHNSAPNFERALKGALALGAMARTRERHIFGQILRLERLEMNNTFAAGEIVRKQIGDIPPEANDNGLQPLAVSAGGGIGHCIAFRYSVQYQVLGIQFDNRAVSVNRFLAYLKDIDPTYDYRADPVVRKDAWAKYNTGLPTKFEIQIAQPLNLEKVEGPVGAVIDTVRTLGEIYEGPVVSIEVTMGRRKGSLAKAAIDSLLRYFTEGAGGAEDVRRLSATSSNEDGSEEVNFLLDYLKEHREIDTPDDDPDEHYEKRRGCLESCFRTHNDYIRDVFGGTSHAND